MKSALVFLFVLAYAVSTALCACRLHARLHEARAEHACCHHERSSDSKKDHPPGHCPHCDGSASNAVAEKQTTAPIDCCAVFVPSITTIALLPPLAPSADVVHSLVPLPPNTLLQLHCALMT